MKNENDPIHYWYNTLLKNINTAHKKDKYMGLFGAICHIQLHASSLSISMLGEHNRNKISMHNRLLLWTQPGIEHPYPDDNTTKKWK